MDLLTVYSGKEMKREGFMLKGCGWDPNPSAQFSLSHTKFAKTNGGLILEFRCVEWVHVH